MTKINLPYNLQDGQKAYAAKVMANFQAILGWANAGAASLDVDVEGIEAENVAAAFAELLEQILDRYTIEEVDVIRAALETAIDAGDTAVVGQLSATATYLQGLITDTDTTLRALITSGDATLQQNIDTLDSTLRALISAGDSALQQNIDTVAANAAAATATAQSTADTAVAAAAAAQSTADSAVSAAGAADGKAVAAQNTADSAAQAASTAQGTADTAVLAAAAAQGTADAKLDKPTNIGTVPTNKVYGLLLEDDGSTKLSEAGGGGGGVTDHAQLSHLGYAESGHEGFASEQALQAAQEGAAAATATAQTTADNAQNTADTAVSAAVAAQNTADTAVSAAATADNKAVAAQSTADAAFISASEGKAALAGAIGSPATASDTFSVLAGHINTAKNTLATNLTAKGVVAAATEALQALVAKVANIVTGYTKIEEVVITSSQTYTFPTGVVQFDMALVGGGAGSTEGGGSTGPMGKGGAIARYTGTPVPSDRLLICTVGAGGAITAGATGGATSAKYGSTTRTANGGAQVSAFSDTSDTIWGGTLGGLRVAGCGILTGTLSNSLSTAQRNSISGGAGVTFYLGSTYMHASPTGNSGAGAAKNSNLDKGVVGADGRIQLRLYYQ